MEKKTRSNSANMVKRLIKLAIAAQILLLILIYFFTKSVFYSIIFCFGAIKSILGFLIMIKMTDIVLKRGRGQLLFILAVLLKLAVITVSLYLVSRASWSAALFYILGLSIIVIAIGMEGIYQLIHSRNKHLNRSVLNGRA